MSFNIRSAAAVETGEVKLLGADNEPLLNDQDEQCSVTVYGPGSKAFAKATAARTQRMMDRAKSKAKFKLSAEDQQTEAAEFLAAVTVSINGFDYEGEKDHAAIKAMYADISIGFIGDQVQRFIGDWENFTKGSSKTSTSTSAS